MAVAVETLGGLDRKVTVSVPVETINGAIESRLKQMASKVKVHGFRPGKVPMHVVKQRYMDVARQEAIEDLMNKTFMPSLKEANLVPVGQPVAEPTPWVSGQDFTYTLSFEIFPEITLKDLCAEDNIELVAASVSEADVDATIETLRQQNKVWREVSRPLAMGDKAWIDFEGFLDDVPFQGGAARQHELVLGSGAMIPGFESGLVGAEVGVPFDLWVTFPEDYNHADLAGKSTRFHVTVTKVEEGDLPALDEAFAKQFNVKDGSVELFRQDIKENMVRELKLRIEKLNREKIFDAFLKQNEILLPKALIDQEIENLKHEMYHRLFGHEHSDDEKIPDFPRSLFEAQAQRRVHLGLLFSEYVQKNKLSADVERVDALIEQLAQAYDDPEELRTYYQQNKERRHEVEAYVLEEMVAEQIVKTATVANTVLSYEDVIRPKQTDKGE